MKLTNPLSDLYYRLNSGAGGGQEELTTAEELLAEYYHTRWVAPHGCMCPHGCMAAWLHGCMAAWLHGCMAALTACCACACVPHTRNRRRPCSDKPYLHILILCYVFSITGTR
jgi:hypothetical protein